MGDDMSRLESADVGSGGSEQRRPDFINVPVGQQVVQVSPELASFLRSASSDWPLELVGTRVWIDRRKEGLDVHLGDVDRSTLEG